MEISKKYIEDFFSFIKRATTAVQTVDTVKVRLKGEGFKELSLHSLWQLIPGEKYYVSPYPSMIVAFTLGSDGFNFKGIRGITAHTDNPALRIKPNPSIAVEKMVTLNVEKYGGPIFNTWFDRPLSVAGRVALRSEEVLRPKVVHLDFARPILTLPNLAIHMNREVNKGVEIKVQKEMQPLLTSAFEPLDGDYMVKFISEELKVKKEDILDYDLYVYCAEEGLLVGANEEFISCPRIDDLAMVYAAMEAMIASEHKEGVNMAVFYDNEEIGSMTRQGADSALLSNIMERIGQGMSRTEEQFDRQMLDTFFLSADGAHALHPNYAEKADLTTKPVMNQGITIKLSANKAYASETDTIAAFQQLCDLAGVSYQKFINHSDVVGGATLGPILSKYLPVPVVDIGVPMLAMHSTRELMGKQDFLDAIKVFTTFYSL